MYCHGITKKGTNCKNKSVFTIESKGFCVKHAYKYLSVFSNIVYNPYYKKVIDKNGEENCGPDRESISKMLPFSKAIASSYCDVLTLSNIKNIVGPMSYNEFRYKGRNIGIFGEAHEFVGNDRVLNKTNSITFSGFLKSLLTQNKQQQYDFFYETDFITKDKEMEDDPMADFNGVMSIIDYDFNMCLKIDKTKCPYKNLRAHYCDFRNLIYFESTNVGNAFNNLHESPGNLPDEVVKYLEMLFINPIDEYSKIKAEISKFLLHKKIQKQLHNMEHEINFQDFIDKIFDVNEKRIHKMIKKYKNYTFVMSQPPTLKEIRFSKMWIDPFMEIYSLIMDVYILARMLRSFKRHTSTNIIVYVGDDHAKTYTKFFQSIGADHFIKISGSDYHVHFDKEKSFFLF